MQRRVNKPAWNVRQPRVAQEYEHARSLTPNRQLYSTKEWKKLREQHLHDYPACSFPGCKTPGSVVDHVVAHRGLEHLFFDPANLQTMCKRHHDSKTVREDGGFGNTRSMGTKER